MSTLTVEEAQAQLPQLLDELPPGGEVVITRGGKPVGRLLPPEPPHFRTRYVTMRKLK